MADPRYALLGLNDPSAQATADDFYSSLPDSSWMNARGIMPQQGFQGGFQPGYVNPAQNIYAKAQRDYEDAQIKDLKGLNITSPDYQEKLQDALLSHQDPNLAQYPRVASFLAGATAAHKELKSYIQKNPAAAQTYANAIKSGMSQDDAIGQIRQQTFQDQENQKHALLLAQHGEDPADYRDKSGNIDPIAAAQGIYKAQQANQFTLQPASDKEIGSLETAQEAYDAAKSYSPSDPEKSAYIKDHPGTDWNQAFDALRKQAVDSSLKKYQSRIQTLQGANRAVPPLHLEASGLPPINYSFNSKGKGKAVGQPTPSLAGNPAMVQLGSQAPVAAPVAPSPPMAQVPTDIGAAPSANPERQQAVVDQVIATQKRQQISAEQAAVPKQANPIQNKLLDFYKQKFPTMSDQAPAFAAHALDEALSQGGAFDVDPADYDTSEPNWEAGAKPSMVTSHAEKFLEDHGIKPTEGSVQLLKDIAVQRFQGNTHTVNLGNGRTVAVTAGTPKRTS